MFGAGMTRMSGWTRMSRLGAFGLLAAGLGGCEAPSWGPSWNRSSSVLAPGDSLTIRRVMGENPEVAPLRREEGRWAIDERPRPRPRSPEQALQEIPPYEPVPRPELENSLQAPQRGSSIAPDLPRIAALPAGAPARAEAPHPHARTPRGEGGIVFIPGQPPGVITGGTERYQTIQQAGMAGGGLIIPQGNGTGIVIGPDGRTTVVPMPR